MRRLYLSLAAVVAAVASWADQPLISFTTSIYETYEADNAFTLVLAGANGGTVEVDCGYGPVAYEVPAGSTGIDDGISIPCSVSSAGKVDIYGSEGTIDYFNGDGCYIRTIEFADPQSMAVLTLEHNELEALDLSEFSNLIALYLTDNPFNVEPLKVGGNKPYLSILGIAIIDNLDPSFDLRDYPALLSLDAMSNPTLTRLDPRGCPQLVQLSIDSTNVSELDLSGNPELIILNISDTAIKEIDLSSCTKLQQLYCNHMSGVYNPDVKLTSLDLSHCPDLYYLFAASNNLTSINVSKNHALNHLWLQDNLLTEIDLLKNENLTSVRLENNYFTFATLPINPGYWTEYEYKQRAIPVPASYLIGTEIDLSDKVLREGGDTYATVFAVSDTDPFGGEELDESYFTYENGKVWINKALEDSVYVAFYNTLFDGITLQTSKFKVKDEAEYGAPDLKISFMPAIEVGKEFNFKIGVHDASADSPKSVMVDFGNGEMVAFDVTSEDGSLVTGKQTNHGEVRVYVPEGDIVTAFSMESVPLTSADFTAAKQMESLSLVGTELTALNLEWNRCLRSLVLNGNNLADFSLVGNNTNYGKNLLTYIDLSDNQIASLALPENPGAMQHLDLSHNVLATIDLTDCSAITYLDLSYNDLELLRLGYCESLLYCDASHNRINEYVAPETDVIQTLIINDNQFTYATLPYYPLDTEHYIYAPQALIQIPTIAPSINLSNQYVEINGEYPTFDWYSVNGTQLTSDQVNCAQGVCTFLDYNVGEIYCEIKHPAFPEFTGDNALRTSIVKAMEMPTHVAATFVTSVADQTVSLSLTASEPTMIFIDWAGDGSAFESYELTTTYTLFEATTYEGAEVKVYSYDEDNKITVFSMTNALLDSFDGSNLTSLTMLALNSAGLIESDLIMPEADLGELSLQDNAITEFDLSRYPNLWMANLAENWLKSVDLTANPKMQSFGAANNQITQVSLGNNNSLWQLYLENNKLQDIDLTTCPGLENIGLNGNNLRSINLDGLSRIRYLGLDHNEFDLATLPLPQDSWAIYNYSDQADIHAVAEGNVVDLSSQAWVEDTPTAYRWWIGKPTYNEEDEAWEGEELILDEDYAIDDGISTFFQECNELVGMLTNEVFPKLTLFTEPLSVNGLSSILNDSDRLKITIDKHQIYINGAEPKSQFMLLSPAGATVAIATAGSDGVATFAAPAAGAYLVATQGTAAKVIIR